MGRPVVRHGSTYQAHTRRWGRALLLTTNTPRISDDIAHATTRPALLDNAGRHSSPCEEGNWDLKCKDQQTWCATCA